MEEGRNEGFIITNDKYCKNMEHDNVQIANATLHLSISLPLGMQSNRLSTTHRKHGGVLWASDPSVAVPENTFLNTKTAENVTFSG